MPRWANRRDANDLEIFRALQVAGRDPIRGRDSDIYARHIQGYGLLIECKTRLGKLRPIQVELQAMFGDRYHVVRSAEEALKACGVAI